LQFDSGYGVNIGMLIDTALSGLSIAEVDVGNLDYDLQPLENLQDITSHFFRSLFKRAIRHGRLAAVQEQELSGEFPLQAKEMAFLRKQAKHPRRIALVDLDYVLLQTPLLVQLAQRTRNPFDSSDQIAGPALGTENISHTAAAFCRGSNRQFLEKVANSMVFKSGAKELVSELRGAGYQVILMSDGFHTIADVLRRRLNADWCIAHALKFDGEIATGKFVPSPAMIHSEGCRLHSLCRENILAHLSERMNIHPQRILVIGGGRQDACLLQAAGRSIGFQPETHETREAATTIVDSTLEHVLPEIRHKYAAK
jgi:phosphoserine phosphatase